MLGFAKMTLKKLAWLAVTILIVGLFVFMLFESYMSHGSFDFSPCNYWGCDYHAPWTVSYRSCEIILERMFGGRLRRFWYFGPRMQPASW